jgi:serine/threonine protein kinase
MVHRQALAKGAVVGEDYEIERVLGAGGFGITYLARDKSLGIQVAIKEYFPASLAFRDAGATVAASSDSDRDSYDWGLERFLAEARTLARLRHPNIVRVSRYFRENGTAYMVLGFVVGKDFEAWLGARGRRPTQKELDAIVGPLIDALEVVHKADVVHRDIKPANIYIQKSDGAPILLDFGAARQALGEQTRATASFVSPGYSPPESHLNDPAEQGPWTDIYGLAATLYRAVVGKAPAQTLSRLNRDTYRPLADEIDNPGDYRPGFLAAIDKGMALRRGDRPQSVGAWRAMLFGDAADEPTLVHRADDDTVMRTQPRPPPSGASQEDTVARAPPGLSAGKRRAVAAGLAILGLGLLYYIYSTFDEALDNGSGPGREIASPAPPGGGGSLGSAVFVPYKNARFGYELVYPEGVLSAQAPPANGGGQSFASADGSFQVNSFASFNSDGSTPESFRAQLQADDPRFANARVTASNADGFSLLANDGSRVHGYIAVFTCGNQLVNVLEISFPATGPDFTRYRDLANRIITSFRPGQGEDTPPGCQGAAATPPPAASATPPPQQQSQLNEPQPAGLFADASLRRMAVYGWSAGGIQNGFWTAGINSNSGVLLDVHCNDGPGNMRNGIVSFENVPAAITGEHQVNVEIGSYVDGAAFNFTADQGVSTGQLQIVEDAQTAGQFLNFLQNVAAGQTMIVRIPDAGYEEQFNLFAADRALGPCLGGAIAAPWVNQGERDGVIGTGVRNGDGGAFYLRCDTAQPTRGNAVIAFAARQPPDTQTPQTGVIKAFVGTRFIDLEFNLVQYPGILNGFIYHVVADSGTNNIKDFLRILGGGNNLRLLTPDLGIDESFTLTGSQRALAACTALY